MLDRAYKIGRVFVEAGQRGFLVGVYTTDGARIDLASHHAGTTNKECDDAYRRASATATSIKRGAWAGSYTHGMREHPCFVRGKVLTVKPENGF